MHYGMLFNIQSYSYFTHTQVTKMKEEPMDIESIDREDEEIDIELTSDDPESNAAASTDSSAAPAPTAATSSTCKQQDSDGKAPKQVMIVSSCGCNVCSLRNCIYLD